MDQALVSSVDSSTTESFYLADVLGSVSELTSVTGQVTEGMQYDAWGNVIQSYNAGSTPVGFTGQLADADTGLDYFGARYYDPSSGVFITQDSDLGNADLPISLNRYLYTSDNPLIYTDPTGHDEEPDQTVAETTISVTPETAQALHWIYQVNPDFDGTEEDALQQYRDSQKIQAANAWADQNGYSYKDVGLRLLKDLGKRANYGFIGVRRGDCKNWPPRGSSKVARSTAALERSAGERAFFGLQGFEGRAQSASELIEEAWGRRSAGRAGAVVLRARRRRSARQLPSVPPTRGCSSTRPRRHAGPGGCGGRGTPRRVACR